MWATTLPTELSSEHLLSVLKQFCLASLISNLKKGEKGSFYLMYVSVCMCHNAFEGQKKAVDQELELLS